MKTVFLEMERLRNPYSGLGQFCKHLGKEFAQKSGQTNLAFTCYIPENQLLTFGNAVHYKQVSKWHKFFPIQEKYDIWHCLHQDSTYLPKNRTTKLILTIHDLNFLERTDYSLTRKSLKIKQLQDKIDKCSAVTYISEFTKKSVHQHLKISSNIIERVIYNGNNIVEPISNNKQLSSIEDKFKDVKFIFSIGIIQPKKNFHVILPILQYHKELSWLIAGDDAGEYTQKIKKLATELGVSERVYFLGKVQEVEKYWLYENCEAFVFPSLSEGFGLPVVEAMSFGKPVFLSRLTSLPEIGGEVAYYFDDFSPETIITVFENGLADFQKNGELAKKIKQRAELFSWEKAAQEYMKLYEIL